MLYTSCPRCHLTLSNSARSSTADHCPRCHSALQRAVDVAAVRKLQRAFAQRDSLDIHPRANAN